MSVCCECCVLSGRGLYDELITRPEESYRLWCVIVCDLETSLIRKPWPHWGLSRQKQTINLKAPSFEGTGLNLNTPSVVEGFVSEDTLVSPRGIQTSNTNMGVVKRRSTDAPNGFESRCRGVAAV